MPVIAADQLMSFARSLLAAGGADEHEAEVVSDSLVNANLRGHDSHGVMRVPFYLDQAKQGWIQSGSRLTILSETASAVVGDGNWGFGQVVSRDLVGRVIEKAAETGIGCGSLKQSAHIGRLGEYAEMAAEKNMTAIITANTHGAAKRVAPVGGTRPRLGTNPICMGVPGGKGGPFVLDFGTSATAEGKVRVKKIAGEKVPDGWLLDPDGNPTNDPEQLYGEPPGTILPMGGNQAYKGFGLAFMIELFCSGLSGAPCVNDGPVTRKGNAAMFVVIDPVKFAGADHLLEEVGKVEEYMHSVPLKTGVDGIMLPGDPEKRVLTDRQANGIPLDAGNWQALLDLAEELDVTAPSL